jgi:hypothetical protein
MTGVFHFMAVSLDLSLLIHAISVLQTCQLGVPSSSTFNHQRHLIPRSTLRIFRAEAAAQWLDAVAAT